MTTPATPHHVARDQRGAVMLIGLFMGIFLVAAVYYVVGIGDAIAERERMQDAADSAALSAAVLHARGMNTIALVNMVMAALLAILLALKLVETLAGIAIVLIAIGAFLEPALATFIPGIQSVRSEVSAARAAIEPEIQSALETLHVLARGIRIVVPAAAQARAIELVSAHDSPPAQFGFVVPAQIALPTQDAPFSQLCDRAGAYVGKLVSLAIAPIAPDAIADGVGDAADELSRAPGDWYCSAASKPPATHVRRTRQHPTLPARAACIAYDVDRADYDAKRHEQLCATAARQEQASRADPFTGACVNDCAPGGPYDERITLARSECAPDAPGEMTRFWWVQRELERAYVFHAGAWRILRSSARGRARQISGRKRPCGAEPGAIGPSWNLRVHAPGSDEIEPLCSSNDGPKKPASEGTLYGPVRVIEVLEILGCSEDFVMQRDAGSDPNAGRAGDDQTARSPQMLTDTAELGEEAFQLRAYVAGAVTGDHAEQILKLSSWGDRDSVLSQAADQLTLARAAEAGRSAFAQAEYYYAVEGKGAAERASFLWNMRWQARFRRFRLPRAGAGDAGGGSDAEDFGVQAATLDAASACELARSATAGASTSAQDDRPCPHLDRSAGDLVIH